MSFPFETTESPLQRMLNFFRLARMREWMEERMSAENWILAGLGLGTGIFLLITLRLICNKFGKHTKDEEKDPCPCHTCKEKRERKRKEEKGGWERSKYVRVPTCDDVEPPNPNPNLNQTLVLPSSAPGANRIVVSWSKEGMDNTYA